MHKKGSGLIVAVVWCMLASVADWGSGPDLSRIHLRTDAIPASNEALSPGPELFISSSITEIPAGAVARLLPGRCRSDGDAAVAADAVVDEVEPIGPVDAEELPFRLPLLPPRLLESECPRTEDNDDVVSPSSSCNNRGVLDDTEGNGWVSPGVDCWIMLPMLGDEVNVVGDNGREDEFDARPNSKDCSKLGIGECGPRFRSKGSSSPSSFVKESVIVVRFAA